MDVLKNKTELDVLEIKLVPQFHTSGVEMCRFQDLPVLVDPLELFQPPGGHFLHFIGSVGLNQMLHPLCFHPSVIVLDVPPLGDLELNWFHPRVLIVLDVPPLGFSEFVLEFRFRGSAGI
jgi:hypothetical protein